MSAAWLDFFAPRSLARLPLVCGLIFRRLAFTVTLIMCQMCRGIIARDLFVKFTIFIRKTVGRALIDAPRLTLAQCLGHERGTIGTFGKFFCGQVIALRFYRGQIGIVASPFFFESAHRYTPFRDLKPSSSPPNVSETEGGYSWKGVIL